ncbi:traub transciption factor family protein [Stemphylium lycopersici]|uniref:Protein BFR2 n=1 Tax=Stemphylium lycopersici TaxID=183478 RepID=A0A364MSJ9_STELY|nr:transcription factor aatf che-1 protein [Stemphylium lycopersici]RAQ99482.1 traub transciption factor family protein [Stemphylium lycopersici]RAR02112.1 traub transciption factor family protein [Stemphylium lycopersici]
MKKSKTRDFDPESLLDPAPSSSEDDRSDADSSEAEDDNAGREHYTAVGKSKLRKPVEVPLGPKYAGRKVDRKALEESDSDDPFSRGFDEEDSEASDEEAADGVNGMELDGEDETDQGNSNSDEDDDMSDEDDDDMESAAEGASDDDGDSEASGDEQSGDDTKTDASAVRSLMAASKSFTSTIAAGTQSDVAKGEAVKTQRKTFDTLLNSRIRLQKALISTNSMVAEPYKTETAKEAPVEAAEAAALTLLNNLTNLRLSLEESRTGQKRKRTAFDSATPSSEIWSSLQESEKTALPHRKAVLERWSNKTKATTVTNNKARLNSSAQQTLTEVLDSQLTSSHLVTRTQTPRSCAPLQSSNKAAQPDPAIYDDADFYGLMLKELLEQRSADLNSNGTAEFVVQAPWQVAREAKTKKVVDTKASKGRRLRYTVQEKLQNFMAPEERGGWGDRQRDELFSSLFGQRLELGEHDEVESEAEDGVDAEEAGLMLFRS